MAKDKKKSEEEIIEESQSKNEEQEDEITEEKKQKVEEQKVEEQKVEEQKVEEQEVMPEEERVTDQDPLEVKNNEAKDYLDRLQRNMAEFDNFRKRTIKEKTIMYENGVKETLEKLLPVVDNFERAIENSPEENQNDAFVQGVEMIFKQLRGVLSEMGVEEIEAQNNEFDPNLHHAVTHAEDEKYDENVVIEVFQKGYMYKETVLRHSMVKVVN